MKVFWILCLGISLGGCSKKQVAGEPESKSETRVENENLGHRLETSRKERVTLLKSPTNSGAGEVNLTSIKDDIYLSWLEKKESQEYALRFSKWDGTNWSSPKPIVSSKTFFVNWADFPSILALSDGSLVAHWMAKSGSATFSYDVMVSRSTDTGKTWSKPVRPHRDGTKTEHGFVSLVDRGSGNFAVVWLDGRNFESEEEAKESSSKKTNEMTLRFATYKDGAFQPEVLLDSRVCECCQTSAVATKDGLFVVYRDRSADEVRDIAFVRFVNGKWTKPETLFPDGWNIEGCPVNGPSAAATGNQLVVTWPTFANDQGRVQAIFSPDGGKTFGKPVRVDLGNPVGRVDVEWCQDGSALVSWVEDTDHETTEIRLRKVWPDGRTEKHFTITETSNARASGFPRLARSGSNVFIGWTEVGKPSRIHVAKFGK